MQKTVLISVVYPKSTNIFNMFTTHIEDLFPDKTKVECVGQETRLVSRNAEVITYAKRMTWSMQDYNINADTISAFKNARLFFTNYYMED